MDRRLFPEISRRSAGLRQPDPDPEEFSRLSLRCRRGDTGVRDTGIRDTGIGDTGIRDTGTRDTGTAGEEPQGEVTAENVPSGTQPLGEDFGDEPAAPRRAGNVPEKEKTERPQAESGEDEEGESRRERDGGISVGMLRAGGDAGSGEEEPDRDRDWDWDSEDSDWDREWDQDWDRDDSNWDRDQDRDDSDWDRDWDWEDQDRDNSDWDRDWDRDREQGAAVAAVSAVPSPVCGALREEFPAVWARSALDCGLLAEEELLDVPAVPPQPQPRLPPRDEGRMAELLQEYLREGIVVPASSGSNNALILRRKPNGRGWRLCLDCRALNAAAAGPAVPSERPDRAAVLASVPPRSRFFSVLDLCSACLAVPLAPACRPRFAFTFRGRQFAFARLPPGFRGTAAVLQRRVAAMLARLEPGTAPGVLHYCDDILITGKSWRQAEERTRRVLELIQSTGFKVNPAKARLVQRRVDYLGVALSAAGRGIPEEKVREIRRECDSPGPWDARRLRSVLRRFEARQEFVADFWELALPLERLARGERPWEWRREQRERLRRLCEALEDAPVLRFPLRSRCFVIRLRVSAETAAARLLQERAGALRPVGHRSHRLSGRRPMSPWDAWLRAALGAVRAFRALTGPAPVVMQDPNGNFLLRGEEFVTSGSPPPEPWTLLAAIPGPEPRGGQNIVIPAAPPLGRLPAETPRANVWFLAVQRGSYPCASVGFVASDLEERRVHGVSGRGSEEDAELEALREILERHRSRFPLYLYCDRPGLAERLENLQRGREIRGNAWPRVLLWLLHFPGMLLLREAGAEPAERERLEKLRGEAALLGCITRSSWIRWTLSRPERREMVARCHQAHHEDAERTADRLGLLGHWLTAEEDATRWARSCPVCRDGDAELSPQRADGLWSRLRIGLSSTLPGAAEGFGALLLVQDEFSGWLDAFPLRQLAPGDVSRALLRRVFAPLGSVAAVLVPPEPAWLRSCLEETPLRRFWSRLELSEPPQAAAEVCGAARAAGEGWPGMLPLILAAVRSRRAEAERLLPLLCVPGLPLELRWEWPGREPWPEDEISRLRGMLLLPGQRERVEDAIRTEPEERSAGICVIRDWARPDPGSEFARDPLRVRWVRPERGRGGPGAGIGMGQRPGLP